MRGDTCFSESPEHGLHSSLYLNDGADAAECRGHEIELTERGMTFPSPWHFCLGAQLAVTVYYDKGEGRSTRIQMDGIIVACDRVSLRRYRATLLFEALPNQLQHRLQRLAYRLNKPSAK